jgi:hypothetical protein
VHRMEFQVRANGDQGAMRVAGFTRIPGG